MFHNFPIKELCLMFSKKRLNGDVYICGGLQMIEYLCGYLIVSHVGRCQKLGKSIFLPIKKEKNKIRLCLGSLAGDRRVSEARYYSPYLKGKKLRFMILFVECPLFTRCYAGIAG